MNQIKLRLSLLIALGLDTHFQLSNKMSFNTFKYNSLARDHHRSLSNRMSFNTFKYNSLVLASVSGLDGRNILRHREEAEEILDQLQRNRRCFRPDEDKHVLEDAVEGLGMSHEGDEDLVGDSRDQKKASRGQIQVRTKNRGKRMQYLIPQPPPQIELLGFVCAILVDSIRQGTVGRLGGGQ